MSSHHFPARKTPARNSFAEAEGTKTTGGETGGGVTEATGYGDKTREAGALRPGTARGRARRTTKTTGGTRPRRTSGADRGY